MKSLSVVIPVYNEKNFIQEIINKVKEVTLPDNMPKEIIIVDDFSTDGTREILSNYGQDESCVVVFHDRNLGKRWSPRFGQVLRLG